jgi:hypothetical protein
MSQLIKNITNALICGVVAIFVRYFINDAFTKIPKSVPVQILNIKLANEDVLKERGVQGDTSFKSTLQYDSLLCGVIVFLGTFLQGLFVQATHFSIFKYTMVNNLITAVIVSAIRFILWKFNVLQKIPETIPVIGGISYLNETTKEYGTISIYAIVSILALLTKKLIQHFI